MMRTNNKKGFSLIEVVVAIGMIAVISGFILQLFITAKSINQKSNDLNESILLSTNIIEIFKSGDTPADLLKHPMAQYALTSGEGDAFSFTMYYDNQWNLLKNQHAETAFNLKAEVMPIEIEATSVQPQLASKVYTIKISITKNQAYASDKQSNKELYSIEAAKYFSR